MRVHLPKAQNNLRLKVTGTLLFALKRELSIGVYANMNMETTNSIRVRASRFFSDRYAYRTHPDYLSELVAFGTIVLIAIWPITLLADAMAAAPR
jgi:Uri superfamily endonuclease